MENSLAKIQSLIKAPKGQFNNFGKYKYRSCEDIVEAIKPVINPLGFWLLLSDDLCEIGNRIYVKATATLTNGTESYQTTAFAREEEIKKGMDGSQITGAASSYARKYALNGLFAIDDTKDADATNQHDKNNNVLLQQNEIPTQPEKDLLKSLVWTAAIDSEKKQIALQEIENCQDYKQLEKLKHRLEDLQPSIDEIPNPNQGDIKRHVRQISKAPVA